MDKFEASFPLLFRQRELFKTLASERRPRHRDLRNKGKLMRKFYTGDLVVLRKQVKPNIKYGVPHKLVFRTKGYYRFLENYKPRSYWLQRLNFCVVLGRPRRKAKEPVASMENIPCTMVL